MIYEPPLPHPPLPFHLFSSPLPQTGSPSLAPHSNPRLATIWSQVAGVSTPAPAGRVSAGRGKTPSHEPPRPRLGGAPRGCWPCAAALAGEAAGEGRLGDSGNRGPGLCLAEPLGCRARAVTGPCQSALASPSLGRCSSWGRAPPPGSSEDLLPGVACRPPGIWPLPSSKGVTVSPLGLGAYSRSAEIRPAKVSSTHVGSVQAGPREE